MLRGGVLGGVGLEGRRAKHINGKRGNHEFGAIRDQNSKLNIYLNIIINI